MQLYQLYYGTPLETQRVQLYSFEAAVVVEFIEFRVIESSMPENYALLDNF